MCQGFKCAGYEHSQGKVSNLSKELSRVSAVNENPGGLWESFSPVPQHSLIPHFETNHDKSKSNTLESYGGAWNRECP